VRKKKFLQKNYIDYNESTSVLEKYQYVLKNKIEKNICLKKLRILDLRIIFNFEEEKI
jgi:mRNA-degrading endonuclease RelE of RelBE toxin-antitoxin system